MAKKQAQEPTFEELYTELEATIEKLEAGNLSLDDALALYERGMALAKLCNTQLDGAELRIQELAPSSTDLEIDEEESASLADDDEEQLPF